MSEFRSIYHEGPMKILLPLIFAAFAAAGPINLEETPNPDVAVYGKAFSPNGVYGFWHTPSTVGADMPIFDGPSGMTALGGGAFSMPLYYGALVDDTGFAILAYESGTNGLYAFDYTAELAGPAGDNNHFQFPGDLVESVGSYAVEPLSLVNRIYTARIFNALLWFHDGPEENGGIREWLDASFTAQWDFSQGFDATAVALPDVAPIPEPGTWSLAGGALALWACSKALLVLRRST